MKASIDEIAEKLSRQIRDDRDKKASRRKHVDRHALDARAHAVDAGIADPGA